MNNKKLLTPTLLVTTLALLSGAAHASSFTGLGFLSGGTATYGTGLSGDGSTVIGWGNNSTAGASEAFYWTQSGGITPIGYLSDNTATSYANNVSRDGSTIVGMSANSAGTWQAYSWTSATGIQQLPGLVPGFSRANAVSADGSIIVGGGANGSFYSPTLWNNGVVQDLGHIAGGVNNGFGWGISTDGTYAVGNSTSVDGGQEAFLWSQTSGLVETGFATGITTSSLSSVSDSGVAAGNVTLNGVMTASLWSQANGFQVIQNQKSSSLHITPDGQLVVGLEYDANNQMGAFIWDQAHGSRDLKSVLLNDYGLDTGSWVLSYAASISDNGTVISGYGVDPTGKTQAWVANLSSSPAAVPVPGAVWLFGSALAGLIGFGRKSA